MKVAEIYSKLSCAKKLKVGAILVKDDRILSIGYNGTPSNWDNNCENKIYSFNEHETMFEDENGKFYLKSVPYVIHAESNCLSKMACSHESSKDSIMFVTHSPCLDCSKLIYQSKILCVFYKTPYKSDEGINFLNKMGTKTEQVIY